MLRQLRELDLIARQTQCMRHPTVRLGVGPGGTIVCQDCGGPPDEMRRRLTETEKFRQGLPQVAAVKSVVQRRQGEWHMNPEETDRIAIREPTATEIATVETRMVATIPEFRALRPADKRKATAIVHAYDAQAFHFSVLPFNIKGGGTAQVLVLNRDGTFYCARKTMGKRWRGVNARAMTPDERRNAGLPDNVYAWVAHVFEGGSGVERFSTASAIGIAGGPSERNQLVKTDPITNGPYMAQKRAEVAALNKAAPLGVDVGSIADEGDPILREVEAPPSTKIVEGKIVDTTTGEVLGTEAPAAGGEGTPTAEIPEEGVPMPELVVCPACAEAVRDTRRQLQIVPPEECESAEHGAGNLEDPLPAGDAEPEITEDEGAFERLDELEPRTEIPAELLEEFTAKMREVNLGPPDLEKLSWQGVEGTRAMNRLLLQGWSPADVVRFLRFQLVETGDLPW